MALCPSDALVLAPLVPQSIIKGRGVLKLGTRIPLVILVSSLAFQGSAVLAGTENPL